jgi:transposase-like protein
VSRQPQTPQPVVTAPAGGYAVPDPDDAMTMTTWLVDERGAIHRYPANQRWEPVQPEFDQIADRGDRTAARQMWYRDVYHAWRRQVIDEISRDPATARARFAAKHPEYAATEAARRAVLIERRLRELKAEAERRRGQAALAALLADGGASTSAIARHLGAARSTTALRITAGRLLWVSDRAAARAALTQYLEPAGDPAALVARLLAAAGMGASQ